MDEPNNTKDNISAMTIEEFLNDHQYEKALEYLKNTSHHDDIDVALWEIMPNLTARLNKKNYMFNKKLFHTCEEMLNIIVDQYNPNELAIICFAQRLDIENLKLNEFLKILAKILKQLNLINYIEWVADVINYCINDLPLPPNIKPIVEEKISEEATEIIQNLIEINQDFQEFFNVLSFQKDEVPKVNHWLVYIYLKFFGGPYSYIPFSNEIEDLYMPLIKQLCQLTGNAFDFLHIIEDRSFNRTIRRNEEDSPTSKVQIWNEIPDSAFANYFYILLTSEAVQDCIPQVYHPQYLMNPIFYLGNYCLKQKEYIMIFKGLSLIDVILQRIEIESISSEVMLSKTFTDLFTNLFQIMMYCDLEYERKRALEIFRDYIKRFDMKARHLVLTYLYQKIDHSGCLVLVTSILKEAIIQSLDQVPHCEYFIGDKLKVLMKKICHFPPESLTNPVEKADEIMATLNLIRYLILRDKTNITGIWTWIEMIRKEYLEHLKDIIQKSRRDYTKEIKYLEAKQNNKLQTSSTDIDNNFTLSVDRVNLPPITDSEKIKLSHQAITILDMIDSIRIRINECIKENFLKI